MNNRPAREVMTTPVVTIRGDEIISNFIDKLLGNGINGLPVVDNEGNLLGIATRTELLAFELKRELGTLYENNLQQILKEYMNDEGWSSFKNMVSNYNRTITVKDIMITDVFTADKETAVKEICRQMKERQINHVIITDNGVISGIITPRDIIGLVADGE